MVLAQLISDLEILKNPQKAKILAGFFKTGKGEYGEGDVFWGISVPNLRIVAKKYSIIETRDIIKLFNSEIHEQRLTALLILVDKFKKANFDSQKSIFEFYLANTKYINNWDLVDLSAPNIVGGYLLDKNKEILTKLAKSKNLWERRIAILATYAFIKESKFTDTLEIAEILLNDRQDLIHKAVGWMLRELGKRDQKVEEQFLIKHYRQMPRTMLRYAIEKFDEEKKRFYM